MADMSIDQALAYLDRFRAAYQGVAEAAEALRVAVQTQANIEALNRELQEIQNLVAEKKHELAKLDQEQKQVRQRLNKQLQESQAKIDATLKSYEEEYQKLRDAHDAEFAAIKAEHERELDLLRRQRDGLMDEVNSLTVTKESLEQEINRLKSLIAGIG